MAPPRKKNGSIDWEAIYEDGENPNGMMAQTANETVRRSEGMRRQDMKINQSADGDRWNNGFAQDADIFSDPVKRARKKR